MYRTLATRLDAHSHTREEEEERVDSSRANRSDTMPPLPVPYLVRSFVRSVGLSTNRNANIEQGIHSVNNAVVAVVGSRGENEGAQVLDR